MRAVTIVLLVLAAAELSGQSGITDRPATYVVASVEGGSATFRRQTWSRQVPARFGTLLRPGDLINLPIGVHALVVCDGYTKVVRVQGPGLKAPQCGETKISPTGPRVPTARIEVPLSSLSAGVVAAAPALPSLTYESAPLFKWPGILGADAYEVTVDGRDFKWSGITRSHELLYSDERLRPGRVYSMKIMPLNAYSHATGDLSFVHSFVVLSSPPRSASDTVETRISGLAVSGAIKAFLLARGIAQNGLYDLAITALEELLKQLREPAVLRELGNVYAAKGSTGDAKERWLESLALFEQVGDVIGLAETQEALANIETATPQQLESGIARLRIVHKIYGDLGDKTETSRLTATIQRLELLRRKRK